MSLRCAANQFNINLSTLHYNLNPTVVRKPGRPPVLSDEEETVIRDTIKQVTEWGFGFCRKTVALLIKGYLDQQGRVESRFKDNLPGEDFVVSFMKRNKMVYRKPGNIKRARSSVSAQDIESFFREMEAAGADQIPSTNIYNFDETALSDDPGACNVVVPRGARRVEVVKEHSKVNISIMICGSAEGELLPPHVVYKATNLYEGWTVGGPSGAQYSVSKSGWFDMDIFEKWFRDVFLEAVRSKPGRKILIGDNLASHFSVNVVRMARENDILFVALPPNTTHIMQPLDVSVFRPFKRVWATILDRISHDRNSSRNQLVRAEYLNCRSSLVIGIRR